MSEDANGVKDSTKEIARLRGNLRAERDGVAIYRAMAAAAKGEDQRRVFLDLARAEHRHADRWEAKLRGLKASPDVGGPSFRARTLAWLAPRLGNKAVASFVNAAERRDAGAYLNQPDAADFARDETAHARALGNLAGKSSPTDIAGRETWHRAGGGSLRATVFGANDGLVSNLSLVMGVAGGVASSGEKSSFVLLAGIAGLLAGAFSMAAGEYVSVKTQREVFEKQLSLEADELAASPEEEAEELALIYQSKGIPRDEAERLAKRLLGDDTVALDTLAREELGLDPSALGSPWGAAGSSFVAFSIGAVLPVLPFLFVSGLQAVLISAVLSAIALFAVGSVLSLFTGRNPLFSGGRMLGIGSVAALVTYVIGNLIGVSVGG
ncbi:MAG: VIT1/CCC1 transporter family protein [Chloroflexota bacterium]